MVRRYLMVVAFFLALLPTPAAFAQAAPGCRFVLGFAALHDLIPAVAGDCIDNQSFATNGDALQHTTRGLMVWRKADNWTAFTDGFHTWLHGYGVQERLNTQRFNGEVDRGSVKDPSQFDIIPDTGQGDAPGCPPPPGGLDLVGYGGVDLANIQKDPTPYVGRCIDFEAYSGGNVVPENFWSGYAIPKGDLAMADAGMAFPHVFAVDLSGYPAPASVLNWLMHAALLFENPPGSASPGVQALKGRYF